MNKIKLQWSEPTSDFEWPLWKRERDRINHNTFKFRHVSIAEAFGLPNYIENEEINEVPSTPKVGAIIMLKIKSVGKNGVVFDPGTYKCNFLAKNNLHKYKKFQEFIPTSKIPCEVISVKKDLVCVDILRALASESISEKIRNPWIQNKLNSEEIRPYEVRNIVPNKGGFVGDLLIPEISEWVGEDFTFRCFIPKSHSALNILKNFDETKFHSAKAFIINQVGELNQNIPSIVVSVKAYLEHLGNLNLLEIYKMWCDDSEQWKEFSERVFDGIVTGVINSSKVCGVFVEISELHITGMVKTEPDKLVEYASGSAIKVKFHGIELPTKFNPITKQTTHEMPFKISDGCLEHFAIKPTLKVEQ